MRVIRVPRGSVVAVIVAVLGSLAFSAELAHAQLTLHVTPGGNYKGTGAADSPFATLEQARDAVRALKGRTGLPAGGVRIVLHGGTYRIERPLILTAEDSGRPGPDSYRIRRPSDQRFSPQP
jgi:hypothetical protein